MTCSCLEGRRDLLDAAALRYRALRYALSRVFWKDRLRRNAEVLRATAEAQTEVDETLAGALRRAEAEGWPSDDPWVHVSGFTWPDVDSWIRSSPTAEAASTAVESCSFVMGSRYPVSTAWAIHTPAKQSACSSVRTE